MHADVRPDQPVPQLDVANAALEALDVVKQTKALDNHSRAPSQLVGAMRALFPSANAQHFLLVRNDGGGQTGSVLGGSDHV